jgi:hypothetical protein
VVIVKFTAITYTVLLHRYKRSLCHPALRADRLLLAAACFTVMVGVGGGAHFGRWGRPTASEVIATESIHVPKFNGHRSRTGAPPPDWQLAPHRTPPGGAAPHRHELPGYIGGFAPATTAASLSATKTAIGSCRAQGTDPISSPATPSPLTSAAAAP